MSDPLSRDFSRFSQDKLRPAVDVVTARKRSGLFLSAIVAVVLFAIFAAAFYFMISPYRQLMGENDITYWPLLLLAPAAIAMIGFCLAYILTLRNAVKEFRETLVARMAEFIDPGLVHETKRPFSQGELESSLLFPMLGKPFAGQDRFRGRADAAGVDIGDLQVQPEGDGGTAPLAGLFFIARFPREFRSFAMLLPNGVAVSLSGVEAALGGVPGGLVRVDDAAGGRQAVAPSASPESAGALLSPAVLGKLQGLRARNGAELYLSCRGNALYAAILARSGDKLTQGVFEGFDFAGLKEFCRDAAVCMDMARDMGKRDDLWKAP